MTLIISIILIVFGYYTIFSLNPDLAYEELVFKVRIAQISVLIGGFLLAIYLYKKL